MTTTRIENVRRQLTDAMEGVAAELERCRSGEQAIDSERQLLVVVEGLRTMLDAVGKSDRPESPGLWHVVTDTWPYDSPLAKKVVDAEYAYQRLK